MGILDLRNELRDEVQAIKSDGFVFDIIETDTVPSIDDPDITFPNFDTMRQTVKKITTTVLFADLRRSTALSMDCSQNQLAEIYASFVRTMTRAGAYYGGRVRNIIGDRVMVVFDSNDCHLNAIRTATLMNTLSKHFLDKEITDVEIQTGIGIDYGEMLVTKTGVVRHGKENSPNKSLVWLGKPANVASKLTDLANKKAEPGESQVAVMRICKDETGDFQAETTNYTLVGFIEQLYTDPNKGLAIKGCDDSPILYTFQKSRTPYPPILMTKYFYDAYAKKNPSANNVVNGWFKEVEVKIPGYGNPIYGGDVIFTDLTG